MKYFSKLFVLLAAGFFAQAEPQKNELKTSELPGTYKATTHSLGTVMSFFKITLEAEQDSINIDSGSSGTEGNMNECTLENVKLVRDKQKINTFTAQNGGGKITLSFSKKEGIINLAYECSEAGNQGCGVNCGNEAPEFISGTEDTYKKKP